MIDFIRAIQPQLTVLLAVLVFLTIGFFLLKRNFTQDGIVILRKIFLWLGGIVILIFLLFILLFSSINEVPRSKLDDSVIGKRGTYFEKDAKKLLKEKEKLHADTLQKSQKEKSLK